LGTASYILVSQRFCRCFLVGLTLAAGAGCKSSYEPLITSSGAITATADDQRTGWYPNQPQLSPSIVGGPTFGRLWKTTLPLTPGEQVHAQPLYVNGRVLIATEANNLYTLDGETGAVKTSRSLGRA
jgi:outer membrane protein assembly factor BamB